MIAYGTASLLTVMLTAAQLELEPADDAIRHAGGSDEGARLEVCSAAYLQPRSKCSHSKRMEAEHAQPCVPSPHERLQLRSKCSHSKCSHSK